MADEKETQIPSVGIQSMTISILAFSDWRVQSIKSLFDTLNNIENPIDLIIYAGDDLSRFIDADRNVFSELAGETELNKVLAVICILQEMY